MIGSTSVWHKALSALRHWRVASGVAIGALAAAALAAGAGSAGIASTLGGIAWAIGTVAAAVGLVATSRFGRRVLKVELKVEA